MILSARNLLLHLIALAEDDDTVRETGRKFLTGILVDPKGNLTAASTGGLLIEIPAVAADSVSIPLARKLACPLEKAFILPKEVAGKIAKAMRAGMLAVVEKASGKAWSIAVIDGAKKVESFPFEPVPDTFPDYRAMNAFPAGTPKATMGLESAFARDLLGAMSAGTYTTFTLFAEGALVESETPDVFDDKRMLYLPFAGQYPGEAPIIRKAYFLTENLKKLLSAASDGSCSFQFWNDRMAVLSTGKAGSSRAVLMTCKVDRPSTSQTPSKDGSKPSPAPKGKETSKVSEAPKPAAEAGSVSSKKEAAAPEVDSTADEAMTASTPPSPAPKRRFYSGPRRRDFSNFKPSPDQMATLGQRAFFTFLIRSRGRKLSVEDLKPMGMRTINEKIEAMSKEPRVSEDFATFKQWKKLVFLLLEDLATAPEKALPILQGLSSTKATSQAIEKCLQTVGKAGSVAT